MIRRFIAGMDVADKPTTELLRRFDGGDLSAWQELVPYVYDDLDSSAAVPDRRPSPGARSTPPESCSLRPSPRFDIANDLKRSESLH